MTLSWRQIVAYIRLCEKLDRMTQVNDLSTIYVGAQGDAKSVEKMIRELI